MGGNAHLRPQAELEPVGKAGAGVDVHGGAVHFVQKFLRRGGVGSDDGVAVVGAVAVDVIDRFLHAADDLDGDLQIEILRAVVLFRRLGKGGIDLAALGAGDDLDAFFAQGGDAAGKGCGGDRLVDEQALAGVAHGGALGLGVDEDGDRLVEVARLFDIDVAVARARLDDGDGGVFHGVADEPRAAAGDDDVYIPLHLQKLRGALMGGIFDKLDEFGVVARLPDGALDDGAHGAVGTERVFAAAQHHGVAAFQRQPDGVCRDVGARFIDDADDPHRHAHAAQAQAVVQGALFQHLAHGAMQLDQLFQPHGDVVDALFVQTQAVDELRPAGAGGDVSLVFGDDLRGALAQRLGGCRQHLVHILFARQGDRRGAHLCPAAGL